jgi:hypothetical protein
LYKQAWILIHGDAGVELNDDESIASFQDIYNASFVTTLTGYVWAASHVLSVGQMYMDGALLVLQTCLLMEFEAAT